MLKLKRTDTTVPDLFTYVFPQDGFTVRAYDHGGWYEAIKKYAKDNGYSIPSVEDCDDQLCRKLSGEWCEGGGNHSFINQRLKPSEAIRGAKAIASFVLAGNVVSPELAESRALICSRCPLQSHAQGCASCTGILNAVMEAKGGHKTKHDHLLKSCLICKCPNEAQVWVPIDNLRSGLNTDQIAQYEQFRADGYDCWKAAELIDNT